ncbi:ABC transporter ATP-binding protein [Silvibacterium acidisoli]|uniref:ABC transporter ATP-binding protein n=1 Tax=Acidobacteriaceae bacterium ZG23-2 TaxID=2883246 RepID=UPI00406CAE3B
MLIADSLTKLYRGVDAVRNVSFTVDAGEIVGFLGPNGAGKSTTVKMITGVVRPTSGRVQFRGHSIFDDLNAFRTLLGYVPEEAHLYTHLSGFEHLRLIGRLREMPEAIVTRRSMLFLERLGIASFAHVAISNYSKGMKQRVLLASALLHDPQLIVLDEPLSGLDVTTARLFRDILLELAAEGKSILYISHVLEVVEKICDRVVILASGMVSAQGSPAALCADFNARDLQEVFAITAGEPDTRSLARSIVETMHEQA